MRPSEVLEFSSWICAGDGPVIVSDVVRYVASEAEPVLRFEEADMAGAGECAVLADRLDSTRLAPGHYTYHLEWRRGGSGDALHAETNFTVGSRADVASTPPRDLEP